MNNQQPVRNLDEPPEPDRLYTSWCAFNLDQPPQNYDYATWMRRHGTCKTATVMIRGEWRLGVCRERIKNEEKK